MSKHTPGPWENAKPVYPWQGPIVVVDDDVPICYVDDNTHDDATALANARLIAAAPDMLEALENIENDAEHMPDTAWRMVQAAIAKATEGES